TPAAAAAVADANGSAAGQHDRKLSGDEAQHEIRSAVEGNGSGDRSKIVADTSGIRREFKREQDTVGEDPRRDQSHRRDADVADSARGKGNNGKRGKLATASGERRCVDTASGARGEDVAFAQKLRVEGERESGIEISGGLEREILSDGCGERGR